MKTDLRLIIESYESQDPPDSLLQELAVNSLEALSVIKEEAHAAIQRVREKLNDRIREGLVRIIRNS